MVEALIALSGLGGAAATEIFVVFLRVGAAIALLPGFGEQNMPVRVRLGLAIALSLLVWPMLAGNLGPGGVTFSLFASEAITGLALGAYFRFFLAALQIAGVIAAQSVSLSQLFAGSTSPEPMPAISNLLVIGGLAIAMSLELHVKFVHAFVLSYTFLPSGTFPAPEDLASWGTTGFTRAFSISFSLAAPFLIMSVVYNLVLGALNRAMPQLMVAFVGAPALTLGGLILLFLSAPVLLEAWLTLFDAALAHPTGGRW